MLGNDIVDLADPESRSDARHPRFDTRVFCDAERDSIARAPSPDQTRWMLWAAKEAAYKAARRQRPETVFSPRRFRVDLGSACDESGRLGCRVRHGGRTYAVQLEVDGDCVHAVAFEGPNTDARSVRGVARLAAPDRDDPSAAVRELASMTLAEEFGVARDTVRIERTGRIPQVVVDGARVPAVLTLSHHGAFVGFACRFAATPGAPH